MTFELGKQYIVEVTKNGIIPREEFNREKFFDKDHDNLEFLTDEEKTAIINDVLDSISSTIVGKHLSTIKNNDFDIGKTYGYEEVLDIISEFRKGE